MPSHEESLWVRTVSGLLLFVLTVLVLRIRLKPVFLFPGHLLDHLQNAVGSASVDYGIQSSAAPPQAAPHPIDGLVEQAKKEFKSLREQEPSSLADAAANYRQRRGRHPPPLWDLWYTWAKEHNAPMAESLFDYIYEDLEPFWGIPPAKIRRNAMSWPYLLSIRNGTVAQRDEFPPIMANWLGRWQAMTEAIPEAGRPDVDLAFNADDESHLYVPYETLNEYLETSAKTRHTKSPSTDSFFTKYATLPLLPPKSSFKQFSDTPEPDIWRLARDTCHPSLPARSSLRDADLTVPVTYPDPSTIPHLSSGFVANWTAAKSACTYHHLRNVHSSYINPRTYSYLTEHNPRLKNSTNRLTTRILFPLFSTAKLQGVNADIRVPAPMYWDTRYHVDDIKPWHMKHDSAIWQGSANGGMHNETTWTRFPRMRLASIMNGTQVGLRLDARDRATDADGSETFPAHVPAGNPPVAYNFPLPSASTYDLAALRTPSELGAWTSSLASAVIIDLQCDPTRYNFYYDQTDIKCPYSSPFYHATPKGIPMQQFYERKYLPDVDGNGYSARFRSFILSNSVPIKSTVWSEWHDKRLVPWKHFVPMDMGMQDFWGIMEYFVGYRPPRQMFEEDKEKAEALVRPAHDDVGKSIAMAGHNWGRKALRKEDMTLYMWRVILEYARICDERREMLAYVADLI